MDLSSSVDILPGVGSALVKKLSKLNIQTVFDLLYHIPFRYEDRSLISKSSVLQAGETVTLIGTIDKVRNEFSHRARFIQTTVFSDDSGSIPVTWFNQTFLAKTIKPGSRIALYGKVESYRGKNTLVSPEYELIPSLDHKLIHMARIVPVYPETSGVSSKLLRTKIFSLLSMLEPSGYLPDIDNLPAWKSALLSVHFPKTLSEIEPAKKRLAFDELFILHLTARLHRQNWQKTKLTNAFLIDQEKIAAFISSLPFVLTATQNKSVREILSDLNQPKPMNRLLEGDVGSGKTVVAAIAAYCAYLNNFQALILAPTQILAQQHYQTLTGLFKPFGIEIGLITAGSKFKADSKSKIVVGTHALLSKKIKYDRVGLVVIDEQHRFGVLQRGLAASKGSSPHILTMTATPIPRTVALTLYGDLDLSILDNPPSGRIPVKTWVVPENKRDAAYAWINKQLTSQSGRQAFIVCPFIEESESLSSVKAATVEFNKLQNIFPNLRLGLLHGKIKSREKDEVMKRFHQNDIDILVSTPVVEVGIDNPNAVIMLIEGAERFGLAQLHQLRGRVGRGSQQSYCLLFSGQITPRLKSLEKYNSGIQLAEIDLQLRGPGEILGTTQHGLPQFKVAGYSDLELVEAAHSFADNVFSRLSDYPLLLSLIKRDKIESVLPN